MTPDFWQSVTTPTEEENLEANIWWTRSDRRHTYVAEAILALAAPRIVAAAYREAALRLRDLGLGVASHLMATWAAEAEKGVPS